MGSEGSRELQKRELPARTFRWGKVRMVDPSPWSLPTREGSFVWLSLSFPWFGLNSGEFSYGVLDAPRLIVGSACEIV